MIRCPKCFLNGVRLLNGAKIKYMAYSKLQLPHSITLAERIGALFHYLKNDALMAEIVRSLHLQL